MKMNKSQECSWSDLPNAILQLVALKLSAPDVARLISVCSSWYKAAEGYRGGPFLMFPSYDEETSEVVLQFSRVEDDMKVVYTAKNNLERLLDDGRCVGSSHGWLVVLDKLANPWLLNPFSGKEIELPRRENFPHVDSIEELEDEDLMVKWKPEDPERQSCHLMSVKDFQSTVIDKAVISANPSCDKNCKVVIINSHGSKLAFYCDGNYEWTVLCDSGKYQDVVWHDNMLYALANGDSVVVWEFHDSLATKKMIFSPSYLRKKDVGIEFDAIQFYLALSKGDILVIQRYIGDLVDEEGEYLDEILDDDSGNLVGWPYRTLKFKVFKLDVIQEKLSEVKSLQGQVVFVGGNQTISLCGKDFVGLKRDSIYFSDDNWEKINDEYWGGGHDIGIFDLESYSIDMLFTPGGSIEPTPFWVSTL